MGKNQKDIKKSSELSAKKLKMKNKKPKIDDQPNIKTKNLAKKKKKIEKTKQDIIDHEKPKILKKNQKKELVAKKHKKVEKNKKQFNKDAQKTVKSHENERMDIENEEKIDNYHNYITEKLEKIKALKEKAKTKIILDTKLIRKAVKVLLELHEKKRNPKNILDTNEGFVYVEISFNKLPEKFSIRPIQMYIF